MQRESSDRDNECKLPFCLVTTPFFLRLSERSIIIPFLHLPTLRSCSCYTGMPLETEMIDGGSLLVLNFMIKLIMYWKLSGSGIICDPLLVDELETSLYLFIFSMER